MTDPHDDDPEFTAAVADAVQALTPEQREWLAQQFEALTTEWPPKEETDHDD